MKAESAKDPNSEELDKKKAILVDSMLTYYRNFPKDTMTPAYLDKVHMIFSSQENYRMSATYAAAIIDKYPNYVNRKMILESQITTYDVLLSPRDTVELKKWIDLYLKENNNLSKDEVEGYQHILDNISLSFQDRIKRQK